MHSPLRGGPHPKSRQHWLLNESAKKGKTNGCISPLTCTRKLVSYRHVRYAGQHKETVVPSPSSSSSPSSSKQASKQACKQASDRHNAPARLCSTGLLDIKATGHTISLSCSGRRDIPSRLFCLLNQTKPNMIKLPRPSRSTAIIRAKDFCSQLHHIDSYTRSPPEKMAPRTACWRVLWKNRAE